jgi:hypothetical protein
VGGISAIASRLVSAALAFSLIGSSAAQNYDILRGTPPTFISVETDYTGNEHDAACDWYRSASDLINAPDAQGLGRACQVNIRIRGTVNLSGAMLFSNLVKRIGELGFVPTAIVLDSRGGDADAAIAMARLIRKNPVFQAVPVETRISDGPESVCFSACVVLFSAGYRRSLEFNIHGDASLPSRLGIHGPGQFDGDENRYDSAGTNTEIQRVNRRLKDYFSGIGVAEKLVDDMYAVPFDEIRLLSKVDLVSYGLYED